MSTEQDVKDVLLDMLGEEKKVKENTIPRNVDPSYKIVLNLNGKELAIISIPTIVYFVIAFTIIILFKLTSIFMIMTAVILGLILFLTIYGLLTMKPIPSKENIRMIDHIKQKQTFSKRQKVYFYASREEGVDNVQEEKEETR
ncbi:TPA: hypothetical protein ACH942_002390 [Staphylococcus aureus]|uniref:hypothetical protein n=1 Tax=Staphylococcus aureus TaxID=1280 RepID=UPI00024E4794|nr:hypothetical protein [Staphylococcus aureus]EHS25230.1 hypothetical protein IS88_2340 [Staphylococcus aureus subsp. aureus IS-88]MCE3336773.1 hypothetical protein [Staphylococcus aureus]HDF1136603.1 hypothetical protein [Staphylococcus aureus]HDJ5153385.1 hypothetical protein [Staphylococcus aureus]